MQNLMTGLFATVLAPAFALFLLGGVLTVLSLLGGWGDLAKVYRASAPPSGHEIRGIHGSVGATRYKGLKITLSDAGLHLRFVLPWLYPPLFMPWSAIAGIDPRRRLDAGVRLLLRDGSLPAIVIEGPAGAEIADAFGRHRSLVPRSQRFEGALSQALRAGDAQAPAAGR